MSSVVERECWLVFLQSNQRPTVGNHLDQGLLVSDLIKDQIWHKMISCNE